jgi:hypothetical protein
MAEVALQGRGVTGTGDEAGGCCDAGSGRPSMVLALGVLGLVLRRRRRA